MNGDHVMKRRQLCAVHFGSNAIPRSPPSPVVTPPRLPVVATTVGVLPGLATGNETMFVGWLFAVPRSAANQREGSPGICAIIIGLLRATFA
jgi:hypothetical protein